MTAKRSAKPGTKARGDGQQKSVLKQIDELNRMSMDQLRKGNYRDTHTMDSEGILGQGILGQPIFANSWGPPNRSLISSGLIHRSYVGARLGHARRRSGSAP